MKRHLTNAGFGAIDYLSYPIGMLVVAPVILHRIDAAEYGLWMIVTSVISAGSIIASGFGDACIHRIAQLRGAGNYGHISHAAATMVAINVISGSVITMAVWFAAPFAASRISSSPATSASECLIALRIASVLILIRAVESVAVGVQRAFENYKASVQVSASVRLLTLATAAVLAACGMRTISILIATAVFMIPGAVIQLHHAQSLLTGASLWPRFWPGETRILLGRGKFIWLQTLGGVIFGQFDRILLGMFLGSVAVAPYALCVQFTHPIYGLTGAALNFLFPYLSACASSRSRADFKRSLLRALALNAVLVICPAGLLLVFGERIIRLWAGADVAVSAAQILPTIVLGATLLGMSVTGAYAAQALGLFRSVAYFNLIGRAVMLFPMIELLHLHGLDGLALSRVGYGSVALLVYLPLLWQFGFRKRKIQQASTLMVACEAPEGTR
jgi:O-antigen/teichoic acid export membrane protein